jgi:hypothetical protein
VDLAKDPDRIAFRKPLQIKLKILLQPASAHLQPIMAFFSVSRKVALSFFSLESTYGQVFSLCYHLDYGLHPPGG